MSSHSVLTQCFVCFAALSSQTTFPNCSSVSLFHNKYREIDNVFLEYGPVPPTAVTNQTYVAHSDLGVYSRFDQVDVGMRRRPRHGFALMTSSPQCVIQCHSLKLHRRHVSGTNLASSPSRRTTTASAFAFPAEIKQESLWRQSHRARLLTSKACTRATLFSRSVVVIRDKHSDKLENNITRTDHNDSGERR